MNGYNIVKLDGFQKITFDSNLVARFHFANGAIVSYETREIAFKTYVHGFVVRKEDDEVFAADVAELKQQI